ncbi:patatin-like phospholipase RssA [Shewanella sp. NIFS-20-20]|uniref:patatin-like phospholipase RssA n=1 Tax=Shewanella sp. NIFS-20-20 TaxID=2853806 RepID=UPI001C491829|nr:patatin-like phospholipase RssA [Shewanella sp. NIFS-20-20]MBV7315176.1 patatin-like phospholipase RssA [Shewanella sp. NIFS-20-20]
MHSNNRATIGLALGSGAAKGWAHIGVLNGLKKMGIEPDKVAGCSIGALVGAAYANDHLPQLQSWVEGFSSWDVLGMMDLSWRKGGLMGGERVFDQMQASIGAVKIEDLQRPFIAVATDLYSGQEIWFQQGDLRQAVRASCSMPGILAPVRLNQRWLVDGAVVNPVPVSVAKAMNVDMVIAVDLSAHKRSRMQVLPVQMMASAPSAQDIVENDAHKSAGFMDLLAKGKEYVAGLSDKLNLSHGFGDPGMLAVMSQSMEILEQRHKRARLMGDPPDICITPKVADIGTMEFHRASEAIAAGEQAVMDARHLIEAALSGHREPRPD